jgi:uncharacterized repeat protein (TIGR03803 family)
MKSFFALVAGLALTISLPMVAAAQNEITLYSFTGGIDGSTQFGGVVFDSSGNLYGTNYFGGTSGYGTVFELEASGGSWTLKTLHSFAGNSTDVGHSASTLVSDSKGNLYGTGYMGGGPGDCYQQETCGGVFELSKSNGWKESVIFAFTPKTGFSPSGLTMYKGALYGTTEFGPGSITQVGYGTVYELSLGKTGKWKQTILHSFNGNDGYEPATDPVFDKQGNLYGSTPYTFTNQAGDIYELKHGTSGWKLSQIDAMAGGDMIFDSSGNLYLSLGGGGSANCEGGCGSVIELEKTGTGWKQVTLYEFTDVTDGEEPGTLIFDAAGNLYGTTFLGGTGSCVFYQYSGCGTVFKLSPGSGGWKKTTLYNFTGGTDGEFPNGSPLAMDASGNLYGATLGGATYGTSGYGTIYEIQP